MLWLLLMQLQLLLLMHINMPNGLKSQEQISSNGTAVGVHIVNTVPTQYMTRSRIHERTTSLRFLGIILIVLRLEVSVWISETIGKGVWFSIRFSSFLLYSIL
jgi:hypothetical protein